ncbi:MAG TPA: hypothetical protein VFS40_04450 [Gemmatimonadales bacterium]|nr:hypothetical protein [Gemmatimonadales bacterium]
MSDERPRDERPRDEGLPEERLRALYARGPAARADAPSCPAPEALWALVHREGPEPARLATLDHVMACRDCRAEFELLRAIERAGATGEHRAGAVRSGRRWYLPAALAAAVLLAVAVGRTAVAPRAPDVPRGAPSGLALIAPQTTAVVGEPLTFAWHPAAGATRYLLEVLAPDGTVAVSATTTDTVVTPGAARALPAAEYRWWVRADLPGATALRSPLRPLRLRAR